MNKQEVCVVSPVTRRLIPLCRLRSSLDQRREVEQHVVAILDELVGLAVTEAERRAESADRLSGEEAEPPAAPAPAAAPASASSQGHGSHSRHGRHRKKKLTRAACGSAGGLLYQHNHRWVGE